MGKFEELSALAKEKRQGFLTLTQDCTSFAVELVKGLRAYLDCPQAAMTCEEVDEQHNKTGERSPFPTSLCRCFDAFWYFFLRFDFPDYSIGLLVGVKKVETGYVVLLPAQEFHIRTDDDRTIFNEYMFNSLKENLASKWTQPEKKFGFTPPEQSVG
jgi:hypothetical protein